MSGFWGYGSAGHEAFHERRFNELLEAVHDPHWTVAEEKVKSVIHHAFAYYSAVSVHSCGGVPDEGRNKGYITWIFKNAAKQVQFQTMLNEVQTWMRHSNPKAHLMFELEANPFYHSTTAYDTMGMPALTLRTMDFHNNHIKAKWWAELLEVMVKITTLTKGL